MASFAVGGLRMRAVAAAVPSQEVDNHALALLPEASRAGFVQAVGIGKRRVAPPSLCASDLCVRAATALLARTAVDPGAIGALVFVTQTPDHPLPGNATLVQHRLGLPSSAVTLDLNQGCAGYVFGLATLASVMSATGAGAGLLLVGDTITRWLSDDDRSTVPIFSDAGSATLIERADGAAPMCFNLGGDGGGAEAIRVAGGGARYRGDPVHPAALAMRGIDVLHYVTTRVAPNVRDLLAFAGLDLAAPDYFVFHQANRILNESLRRQLGLELSRTPESLSAFGNTSSATIPVTLCCRLAGALAAKPMRLVFSGFGSGFSWGSALLSTTALECLPILETGAADGA